MTEKIPLQDYVAQNGQPKTAKEIGVTQGAISKALATKREIYVFNDNGKILAEEIRKFPASPKVTNELGQA